MFRALLVKKGQRAAAAAATATVAASYGSLYLLDGASSEATVCTRQPQQRLLRQNQSSTTQPLSLVLATSAADTSNGVQSWIARITGPNADNSSTNKIPFKVKRLGTIDMLERTANEHPVQAKYDADWDTPIGRGTFGNVYEAVDKRTGERVAIKKISKKFTNDDTFQREMDAMLFLENTNGSHPSICSMKEHFAPPQDEYFYLVLDLIEGGELFDHLCEYGAYSEKDAAKVIRETASALAFLHGVGMVHSDLKPENLMLSHKDKNDATIKIVDMGCAHFASGDHHDEHRGTALTPGYAPPEVLKHRDHNHAHIAPSFDMWSLGVIMYVMLTGTHPFDLEGEGLPNYVMERRITDAGIPIPIRNCKYTERLSEDALQVLERLLDRDPSRRMTAGELMQHPWVRGETASSTAISGSDRRLQTFLRHQTKVGSTLFKGLLTNSDKHGGSQRSQQVSVLEQAFRDLDPQNRGYISTKELNGITSFMAADAKLSLNELQFALKDDLEALHLSKDQVIYEEGTQGEYMYFLQSGSIRVSSKDGFKTTRLSGDFFGEEALMAGEGGEYVQTAQCLTPVDVLKISRETFEKYVLADEEVEMTMAETDRKRQRERAKVIFGLSDKVKPLKCEPGQTIFKESAPGDLLYILESGKVDISVEGRKVRSLRIGEMTGEHAAFYARKPYNVTAKCISSEGCVMQILDGKEIRKMCKKNKDLDSSFRDIILRRDFKKALVKATGRDFPETEQELRLAFDIVDANKSGVIGFDTLKDAVTKWDASYTDDDIRDMLKSLSIKHKEHLTWEEFHRVLSMFNEM